MDIVIPVDQKVHNTIQEQNAFNTRELTELINRNLLTLTTKNNNYSSILTGLQCEVISYSNVDKILHINVNKGLGIINNSLIELETNQPLLINTDFKLNNLEFLESLDNSVFVFFDTDTMSTSDVLPLSIYQINPDTYISGTPLISDFIFLENSDFTAETFTFEVFSNQIDLYKVIYYDMVLVTISYDYPDSNFKINSFLYNSKIPNIQESIFNPDGFDFYATQNHLFIGLFYLDRYKTCDNEELFNFNIPYKSSFPPYDPGNDLLEQFFLIKTPYNDCNPKNLYNFYNIKEVVNIFPNKFPDPNKKFTKLNFNLVSSVSGNNIFETEIIESYPIKCNESEIFYETITNDINNHIIKIKPYTLLNEYYFKKLFINNTLYTIPQIPPNIEFMLSSLQYLWCESQFHWIINSIDKYDKPQKYNIPKIFKSNANRRR